LGRQIVKKAKKAVKSNACNSRAVDKAVTVRKLTAEYLRPTAKLYGKTAQSCQKLYAFETFNMKLNAHLKNLSYFNRDFGNI
jgi:hypothetical protein